MVAEPPAPAGTARAAIPYVALILFGAALHLPRLHLPFGVADTNAGVYFGLFVHNFEKLGFADLRGVPLALQGIPYLNHPPGLTWLFAALGTGEWAFRLPTAIAAVVAACALFALLRPLLRTGPAAIVGLCLLATPSAVLYSQASYETMVLAFGTMLWLSTLRVHNTSGRTAAGWRAAQVAAAFGGVWMDWSFAFFCLGLIPLVALGRSPREALHRLWVPGAVAAVAAASVLVWQQWAMAGPLIRPDLPEISLAEMASQIFDRPAIGDYTQLAGRTLLAACSTPLAIGAVLGFIPLWRRDRALAAALLIGGLGQPLVFARHATDHVHFFCYTAALLAAAAGGMVAAGDRLRIPGTIALAVVTAGAYYAGVQARLQSDTPFYRNLGGVLEDATRDVGPDGRDVPSAAVTNFSFYPYYVASEAALVEVRPALILEPHRRNPLLPHGYRYLWFRDVGGVSAAAMFETTAELEAFLEPFPRQRLSELEGVIGDPEGRQGYDIRDVELVRVTSRFRLVVLYHDADAQPAQDLAARLGRPGLSMSFEQTSAIPVTPAAATALVSASHVVVLWSPELERDEPTRSVAATLLERQISPFRPGVIVREGDAPLPSAIGSLLDTGACDAIETRRDDAGQSAHIIVRTFEEIAIRLAEQ